MNKNQQTFAVASICLSIILAGAIIAYKPGMVEQVTTGLPSGFRFPSGVGVSGSTLYAGVAEGTSTDLKTISLSGAGVATAQADQAVINLGVETTAETAEEAIRENAELMTEVINAVKALGIDEDDIVTTSYSVYAQYDWTEEGREFTGYSVTNLAQVTVKDLDMVGDVIDAAADNGANSINGISFELSDAKREELKTNAYIAAITDAQDKADLIAETLGLTISGVQSVTESSYTPVRSYDYGYAEAAMDSGAKSYVSTPITSGDLSVTVNVHIVYLFE
ncbi:SIMPL domain-containing protein [archaeon]|nr:SIMPL domain-containing protein [archaeon]